MNQNRRRRRKIINKSDRLVKGLVVAGSVVVAYDAYHHSTKKHKQKSRLEYLIQNVPAYPPLMTPPEKSLIQKRDIEDPNW